MTRPLRAVAALTLSGVTLFAVAACTSGNVAEQESTTPAAAATPGTSAVPTSTPPSTTPPPPASSPSSSSSSSPPASSTPSASTRPTPVPSFTTTCATLSVRVLKGGAIRGAEVAALQFVNDGTTPCTITGTPTAQLQRGGVAIGPRSAANGDSARAYTVPPGDYAESLLRDFSTCNAPLSDALQLRLPGRNGGRGKSITEPIKLRGCTLQVAPAGQPS